jgi:hypothetical protein
MLKQVVCEYSDKCLTDKSFGEEIPFLLWNPKIRFCVYEKLCDFEQTECYCTMKGDADRSAAQGSAFREAFCEIP